MKRLYTVNEVAAITGFSTRKVQRRAQKMRAQKAGRDFRFTKQDVKTIQLPAWHGQGGAWYEGWA